MGVKLLIPLICAAGSMLIGALDLHILDLINSRHESRGIDRSIAYVDKEFSVDWLQCFYMIWELCSRSHVEGKLSKLLISVRMAVDIYTPHVLSTALIPQ